MFWKKKIFKVFVFLVILALTVLLLMVRSDSDISCLYAGF